MMVRAKTKTFVCPRGPEKVFVSLGENASGESAFGASSSIIHPCEVVRSKCVRHVIYFSRRYPYPTHCRNAPSIAQEEEE
jgi:hypothetical protein